jgi:TrpR family trp operon transcriptional repressor
MHRNKLGTASNEDRELFDVFASIKDSGTMRKFFDEIFTKSEIQTFLLRWKLMKMLKAGMPQRKIASELKISLCKITRGAKILKDPKSITNQHIKPIETRRQNAR